MITYLYKNRCQHGSTARALNVSRQSARGSSAWVPFFTRRPVRVSRCAEKVTNNMMKLMKKSLQLNMKLLKVFSNSNRVINTIFPHSYIYETFVSIHLFHHLFIRAFLNSHHVHRVSSYVNHVSSFFINVSLLCIIAL